MAGPTTDFERHARRTRPGAASGPAAAQAQARHPEPVHPVEPARPGPEGPAGPFAHVGCPVLRAASERVLAHWTNALGDALDLNEVEQALAWLAKAIEEAEAGRGAPAGDSPAATTLGRHLLQLLRAQVVTHWSSVAEHPDPDEMVGLLRAFEQVREALEPDWSQYFTSRLSGPDGLDLVVEVAHDLRSPLTSILFLAETLGRGQSGEVNELQKRQLRLIYSAALGLSSMASDVIELARGGDQLMEKDLSPFSVAEMLESVVDMVRPIAEEKGLTLRYEAPPSDYRLGRPLALSRVLLNLTTNALKFTDEGYVEITTRAKGLRRVEFAVRDTGHGISDEALTNLYQPFRRTRGRAGRSGYYFSGTGLGLAMCRKLVETLGSDLRFETRVGWGTRFSFDVDLPPASHL
jgi:signal transduction histidine kinase